jgi:hypothetical protein
MRYRIMTFGISFSFGMTRRDLPPRVRGQRISQQSLIDESRAALKELGANHQLRAEFISELAQVVVQDDQPLLCQQRPKVRPVQDKFWKYAFNLVRDYLNENNLRLTGQTATVEFPDFVNQYSGLTSQSSAEGFQHVLEHQDDQRFADRVDEHLTGTKVGPSDGPAPAVSAGAAPAQADAEPQPAPANPPTGRLSKRRTAPGDGEKVPTPKGKAKGKRPAKAAPAKGKAPAKGTPVKGRPPPVDDADASSGSEFGD